MQESKPQKTVMSVSNEQAQKALSGTQQESFRKSVEIEWEESRNPFKSLKKSLIRKFRKKQPEALFPDLLMDSAGEPSTGMDSMHSAHPSVPDFSTGMGSMHSARPSVPDFSTGMSNEQALPAPSTDMGSEQGLSARDKELLNDMRSFAPNQYLMYSIMADEGRRWQEAEQEDREQEAASDEKNEDSLMQAYRRYSENFYYSVMNHMLRYGVNPETVNSDKGGKCKVEEVHVKIALRTIKRISDAMNIGKHSRLERDRLVYRGAGKGYNNVLRRSVGLTPLPNPGVENNPEDAYELNRKLINHNVTDNAFVSTSLLPNVAESFAHHNGVRGDCTYIRIYAPKGLKAQYIDPISDSKGEQELLVAPGTPMRVLDAQTFVGVENNKAVPQTRTIDAEFIPSSGGEDDMKSPCDNIRIIKYWENDKQQDDAGDSSDAAVDAQADALADKPDDKLVKALRQKAAENAEQKAN